MEIPANGYSVILNGNIVEASKCVKMCVVTDQRLKFDERINQ